MLPAATVCGAPALQGAHLDLWAVGANQRSRWAQVTWPPCASALPRRLEYLGQKQSRVTSEAERQALEKQTQEAEKEVQDIK